MTREIKGVVIIMLSYLAGEVVSRAIGGVMPGGILGMLLLFALLRLRIVDERDIKGICDFVLNNMMVLFVPVTVGLMSSYKALSGGWISATAALAISTFIVLVVVGVLQQYISRRWRR